MNKFLFLATLSLVLVMAGCSKEDPNEYLSPAELNLSDERLNEDEEIFFLATETEYSLSVITNYSVWSAEVIEGGSWCSVVEQKTINPAKDRVKLVMTPNDGLNSRPAKVRFTVKGFTRTLTISQFGYTPEIKFSPDKPMFLTAGETLPITVTGNVDFTYEIPTHSPVWLTQVDNSGAKASRAIPVYTRTLYLKATRNTDLDPRNLTVKAHAAGLPSGSVPYAADLKVTQAGSAEATIPDGAPTSLSIPYSGNPDIKVVIETNIPDANMTLSIPDWLTKGQVEEGVPAAGQRTYHFSLPLNPGDELSSSIVFSYGSATLLTIPITQAKEATYLDRLFPSFAPVFTGDTPLKGESDTSKWFDGDVTTFIDSEYGTATYVPSTLDITFSGGPSIDYIVIHPRSDNATNRGQMPKIITVSYSTVDAPDTYITCLENFTLDNSEAVTMVAGARADFTTRATNVARLKIYIPESYANFICMSEVAIYGISGQDFPFLGLVITPETGSPTVSGRTVTFNKAASSSVLIKATTNMFDITWPGWISHQVTEEPVPAPTRALEPRTITTYRATCPAATSSIGRLGEIVFKTTDGTGASGSVKLIQDGNYSSSNISVTASSASTTNTVDRLIDGNLTGSSNYWQAAAAASVASPISLEFTFTDSPASVSAMRYVPRTTASRGQFTRFDIFVMPAGGDYPETANYSYNGTALSATAATDISFDRVANPSKVKIVISGSSGTGTNYASACEIQFFGN